MEKEREGDWRKRGRETGERELERLGREREREGEIINKETRE